MKLSITFHEKEEEEEEKKKEVCAPLRDILKRREHELSDDAKFNSMIKTFCRFYFPRRITLRKASYPTTTRAQVL